MQKNHYSLTEIARLIGAELRGDGHCEISGVASLEKAQPGQVSFLVTLRYQLYANSRYEKLLPATRASAVLLAPAFAEKCTTNMLILEDTYSGLIKLASLFEKKPKLAEGIHPTAIIGKNTQMGPKVKIGPYCVIGEGCEIGENTCIEANTVISDHVRIGRDCHLFSNVTLHHDICLGDRVIIQSGAVIGSDGFSMIRESDGWKNMPHLGSVQIGNDVQVGCNTTIDRGSIDDTILENGVKLDNQIHIAHGVVIGENTVAAGCVGIAGSTHIGKNCMIGGATVISDNIVIADNVIFTGMSGVGKSITQPGVYSSGISVQPQRVWQKTVARLHCLDDLVRKLRKLETTNDE